MKLSLQLPAYTVLFCLSLIATISGCGSAPTSQIGAFDDASATTDAAFQLLDGNSDGALDQEELQSCLGLRSGAKRIDTNGDQQLDRDEVLARFGKLGSMSDIVGMQVTIVRGGRPLANAKVTLTPAPFLGEGLQSYQGDSIQGGNVRLTGETVKLPGLPTGYYTAHIVQEQAQIDTQLGCEIADDASGSRLVLRIPE